MDNLEWTKKIRGEESCFNVTKLDGSQVEEDRQKRIVYLLSIIAEELCLLRKNPTVVNNYNVSK